MLALPSVREDVWQQDGFTGTVPISDTVKTISKKHPCKGIITFLHSDRYVGRKCVMYGYSCAYALYGVSTGDVVKNYCLFVVSSLIGDIWTVRAMR